MLSSKPTFQEDENGCGVACVAFVLGRSYAHVKHHFFDGLFGDASEGGGGYCRRSMKEALRRAGWTPIGRYRVLHANERINIERVPDGAIGLFKWADGTLHYMVRVHRSRWMDPLWRQNFRRSVPRTWRLVGFLEIG